MQTPYKLLVVNDEDPHPEFDHLELESHLERLCSCRRVSWQTLPATNWGDSRADLILADASKPSVGVKTALEWIESAHLPIPVMVVLPIQADNDVLSVVSRVSEDFIVLPVRPLELRLRLKRILSDRCDVRAARQRLGEEAALANLVGRSDAFLQAIEHVPRFSRTGMPVLVTGETGTGKELCARALHQLGPRSKQPFIAVDCGSVPEQLLENELFGHSRGAFTGADRESRGLIAMADGGTLFLDEVDGLSLSAQAKLLRFLQEHTYRPLGADRTHSADVSVIAASNRDLAQEVREGRFRSDLYFRLDILHLHLPPLRERRGDVELLAQQLLKEANRRLGGPPKSLSRAALRVLERYEWPGNVRELNNVIQRAAVTSLTEWIQPSDIKLESEPLARVQTIGTFREARAATLAAFERRYVEELLRKHRGNVTRAAREAQQDRRAFGRFIKKHGIDRTVL